MGTLVCDILRKLCKNVVKSALLKITSGKKLVEIAPWYHTALCKSPTQLDICTTVHPVHYETPCKMQIARVVSVPYGIIIFLSLVFSHWCFYIATHINQTTYPLIQFSYNFLTLSKRPCLPIYSSRILKKCNNWLSFIMNLLYFVKELQLRSADKTR